MGKWFEFAQSQGFERGDLTGNRPELQQLLNDFMDSDRDGQGNLAFQQTTPGPENSALSVNKGAAQNGWNDFFLNEAKEHLSWSRDRNKEGLRRGHYMQNRLQGERDKLVASKNAGDYWTNKETRAKTDALIKAKDEEMLQAGKDKQEWLSNVEGDWWGENHVPFVGDTDWLTNPTGVRTAPTTTTEGSTEVKTKEGYMADVTEEQRPAFMDAYFKSKGINPLNATENEFRLAESAYERNPDMFKDKSSPVGSGMKIQKGGRQSISF